MSEQPAVWGTCPHCVKKPQWLYQGICGSAACLLAAIRKK